jgi:hypothetical protein
MADPFDLDAIAEECHGPVIVGLVAAVRWAKEAPHHQNCGLYSGPPMPFRCTCGRDEALAPFGADR